ncbi:hypothetical protein C8F04DRAFT_1175538 [Mycena alexandri]|uniref:Uncharacterized protein n=1 Tax=Mycena alexandri TaxID=1745969 RepID=A0AAD6TGF5_9AGAR|nr:hypothetical protein C8F04DRAFT_1175538 [Mycena alexandri]
MPLFKSALFPIPLQSDGGTALREMGGPLIIDLEARSGTGQNFGISTSNLGPNRTKTGGVGQNARSKPDKIFEIEHKSQLNFGAQIASTGLMPYGSPGWVQTGQKSPNPAKKCPDKNAPIPEFWDLALKSIIRGPEMGGTG